MSIGARTLHGVNVCLIPSAYNDNRPLLLRPRPLVAISAALLGIKALAILTVLLTPTPAELSTITSNRIVQFTNTERANNGLPPLTQNNALAAAAKEKGNNMLEQDYFAHISPTGITPWFWIQKHNYSYAVAGENLAIDFIEAEDVVAAWMASPSHKANIVHPDYTETGVAVVTGEFQGRTSTVVVHMFGKPAGAAPATPAPAEPSTAGIQEETPVPASTPAPSPITTPVPVPVEEIPVPRIAITGSETVQEFVPLSITGTSGTIITILANGEVYASVPMEAETQNATIDISNAPDGPLTLRAYATSTNGQGSSKLSESVGIIKDTTGPVIDQNQLPFVVSPSFDTSKVAVAVPAGEALRIAILDIRNPQTIDALDEFGNVSQLENLQLSPTFEQEATDTNFSAPQQMVQLSRRISATTLAILLVLLATSVLIRVRIQHPRLITHATLAILLAATLFVI